MRGVGGGNWSSTIAGSRNGNRHRRSWLGCLNNIVCMLWALHFLLNVIVESHRVIVIGVATGGRNSGRWDIGLWLILLLKRVRKAMCAGRAAIMIIVLVGCNRIGRQWHIVARAGVGGGHIEDRVDLVLKNRKLGWSWRMVWYRRNWCRRSRMELGYFRIHIARSINKMRYNDEW